MKQEILAKIWTKYQNEGKSFDYFSNFVDAINEINLLTPTDSAQPGVETEVIASEQPKGDPVNGVVIEENKQLRELLWLRHGCKFTDLYGDDGEMQCHKCNIDFLRLPAIEIRDVWIKKNLEEHPELKQKLKELFS